MSVAYKKNGTEIPITSAIMGGGANDNYSTEERKIGTWIDGKPLYRKTIDLGNMGNPISKSIDVSALNIKICTNMYGEMHNTSLSNYYRPLPMVDNSALSNNVRVDISGNYIRVLSSGDWASYNGTITLEYTKTTD